MHNYNAPSSLQNFFILSPRILTSDHDKYLRKTIIPLISPKPSLWHVHTFIKFGIINAPHITNTLTKYYNLKKYVPEYYKHINYTLTKYYKHINYTLTEPDTNMVW